VWPRIAHIYHCLPTRSSHWSDIGAVRAVPSINTIKTESVVWSCTVLVNGQEHFLACWLNALYWPARFACFRAGNLNFMSTRGEVLNWVIEPDHSHGFQLGSAAVSSHIISYCFQWDYNQFLVESYAMKAVRPHLLYVFTCIIILTHLINRKKI